jgi:hypothetical protein
MRQDKGRRRREEKGGARRSKEEQGEAGRSMEERGVGFSRRAAGKYLWQLKGGPRDGGLRLIMRHHGRTKRDRHQLVLFPVFEQVSQLHVVQALCYKGHVVCCFYRELEKFGCFSGACQD